MRTIWILLLLFAYFQPLSSQDFAYQSWKSIPNLPAKDICNPLSVDVNNDQIMDLAFS
jgi:hypothetical protein